MDIAESIDYLSCSQIQAYRRNPFYWLLAYGYRLPQAESLPLVYGKLIHSILEYLLKTESGKTSKSKPVIDQLKCLIDREPINDTEYFTCQPDVESFFDLKKSFLQTKIPESDILPALKICLILSFFLKKIQVIECLPEFIEHTFLVQLFSGLPPIKGVIDLIGQNFSDSIIICDHKTVKNSKYSLSAAKLLSDPQMTLYSAYCLFHTSLKIDENALYLQHNQIEKDTGRITLTRNKTTKQTVLESLKPIEESCHDIVSFHRTAKSYGLCSLDIQARRRCDTCRYAYGGCPYVDICFNGMSLEDYTYKTLGSLDMQTENHKLASLTEMYGKAKEHFAKKGDINKFELRDMIAKSIIEGIRHHQITGIIINQHLIASGDPDYGPTLSKLKESKIKTFIEVN